MKDITPEKIRCAGGVSCPRLFEKDDATLVVGGKVTDPPEGVTPGEDERFVEIPRGLIGWSDIESPKPDPEPAQETAVGEHATD